MIIDTSVAAKWFLLDEKDREKAKVLLDRHRKGIEKIIVPDLLYLEIANTFTGKRTIPQKVGEELIQMLFELDLQVYIPTAADILETFRLAKKYESTSYDMLFAVIAKRLNTILVTADEKFVKATKFSHIKLLSQINFPK